MGQYREQVTADQIRDYNRISITTGLRYPLLSSKYQAHKDLLEARSLVREKHHDHEQALRSSQLSLRLHSINYWAAQEKSLLTERFLENDSEMSGILQVRTRTSFLLEADRREFMAAFAMARRNLARFGVASQRAAIMLALLTGFEVEPFTAAFPDLPAPVQDIGRLQALIGDAPPLILGLEEKVDEYRGLADFSEKAYPKGYVALSSSVSSDLNNAPPGYGVALQVNLDFPFKLKQADTAKRASARAALEKAKRELQMARGRFLADAQEDMNQYLAALDYIDALSHLHGLHFDLEPNQLISDAYNEHDLQAQLLDTLQAVKAVTDLPVGLSIHYRYMSPAPEGGICLGCAFKDPGVDEVTLMIYASNPGRVAQIAGPILARFPGLAFSIAQTVECILLPEKSYYTQSRGRFLEQMRSLRAALDFDNFRSVLIQSWEDYCEMKP